MCQKTLLSVASWCEKPLMKKNPHSFLMCKRLYRVLNHDVKNLYRKNPQSVASFVSCGKKLSRENRPRCGKKPLQQKPWTVPSGCGILSIDKTQKCCIILIIMEQKTLYWKERNTKCVASCNVRKKTLQCNNKSGESSRVPFCGVASGSCFDGYRMCLQMMMETETETERLECLQRRDWEAACVDSARNKEMRVFSSVVAAVLITTWNCFFFPLPPAFGVSFRSNWGAPPPPPPPPATAVVVAHVAHVVVVIPFLSLVLLKSVLHLAADAQRASWCYFAATRTSRFSDENSFL